jgi:hypothetical protein
MAEHENKCGHATCKCTVKPGDHFCSDYCAKASSAQISGTLPAAERKEHEKCRCGHPACA